MSEQSKPARPLSPHIQIYRWTLTMMLSILHRATGVALYAGTALLAWWLLAALVQEVSSAWYGRLVLFGYTWGLFHHMMGGIRHFIWDTGRGFDLKHVEIIARITAFLPPVMTLGVWLAAYIYLGAL
jgi:succinate dehydrogenase / fumarate reductase cytochrome b subunit